jgi:hypothetical protein
MKSGSRHVLYMKMPPLEGVSSHRKDAMAEHGMSQCQKSHNCKLMENAEFNLSSELEAIASLFPKHLIICAGTPFNLSARQAPSEFDSPLSPSLGSTLAGNSTVLQEGGILKRYQILTPGLITTLLITLFVIVPVIMLGISALASIQSPLSIEVPKGFDAQEKKVQ